MNIVLIYMNLFRAASNKPVGGVMKESPLSVNVIFHQNDVFLQPPLYKSKAYQAIDGIIRQFDVL